jgi:hypothetical protein
MPMMAKRFAALFQVLRAFAIHALSVRELLLSLLLMIAIGGVAISKLEGIKLGDAIYFAFITGLSIGYGDITPKTTAGQVVSVAIGFVGILFVGLTVAIATRALADTAKQNLDSKS